MGNPFYHHQISLPIEIQIAFVDRIETTVQNWKDSIIEYKDFRLNLKKHCKNIYNAGVTAGKEATRNE